MTPRSWASSPLAEVAEIVGGGTPSRSNNGFFGKDIAWVTPSDLPPIGEVRVLGPVREALSWEGLKNSSAKELPAGAVLFSSRASIGKIAIADRPCCTNQGFANFVARASKIDAWYLAFYLAASLPEIVLLAGKTTFKEVSRGKLSGFPIAYPPLSDQRRIVARIRECIDRIDDIQRLRFDADREARALLPSSLASVFDDLADRCEQRPLETVLADTRYGTSNKCDADADATPVLRIPNVADGRVSFSDLKFCELSPDELRRLALRGGDVLIVRTNGSPDLVGRCAVFEGAPKPFAFASYLIRLRMSDAADPHFMAFYLSSTRGRDAIAAIRRTSAGQYNINSENLRKISVPLLPLQEQRRIAERLRQQQDVVRLVAAEQVSRLSEGEYLRRAVLRKAFSGEL